MKKIKLFLVTICTFLIGILVVNAEENCGVTLRGYTSDNHNSPELYVIYLGGDYTRVYFGHDKELLKQDIKDMREFKDYTEINWGIDEEVILKELVKEYVTGRELYMYVEIYESGMGYYCQSDIIDISLPLLELGKRVVTTATPGKLNVKYNEIIANDFTITQITNVDIRKISNTEAEAVKNDGLDSLLSKYSTSLNTLIKPTHIKSEEKVTVEVDISNVQLEKGSYYVGNFKVIYFDELDNKQKGEVVDVMLYQAIEDENGELYLVDYKNSKFAYPTAIKEEPTETPKEEIKEDVIENPKTGPVEYVQVGLLLVSILCIGGIVFLKRTEKDKVLSFKKI